MNGVLVPVGDDEFLSKKMVWLIENEEIAIRMGREALKIREELSENSVCNEWEKIMNGGKKYEKED